MSKNKMIFNFTLSHNLVGKILTHFKNTPLYIIFYKKVRQCKVTSRKYGLKQGNRIYDSVLCYNNFVFFVPGINYLGAIFSGSLLFFFYIIYILINLN
jgi:hypothetical protein